MFRMKKIYLNFIFGNFENNGKKIFFLINTYINKKIKKINRFIKKKNFYKEEFFIVY